MNIIVEHYLIMQFKKIGRKKMYFTKMFLLIVEIILKRYGIELRAYLIHLFQHAHLVWMLTGGQ